MEVIKASWQAAYDLAPGFEKTIVGDESKEALQTQIKGATNELTAAGSNTIQSLGTTASETLTQASYATGQSGVSKSLLTVLAASTLGPLLLAALLTVIVITVIGGSLNDLPFGYELPGSYLGKLGMLNTTDMACLAIDQSTFRTTEGVAMIKPLQEAAIQVMRHQGMRNRASAVRGNKCSLL